MSNNDFSTMDVTSPVDANPYGGNNNFGDNYYGSGGGDGATKVLGVDNNPWARNQEINEKQTSTLNDGLDGTTEIVLPASVKLPPAVGWLVCVEGVDKGKSFRLVKGNNAIGRPGSKDKYAIGLTDQHISRTGAVGMIVYDEKHNRFFAMPGDVRNNLNPYLNDEILLSPKPLEARARIEIAGDILIFVPFCCDKFVWKFSEEKEPAAPAPADERNSAGTITKCPHGHYYNTAFYSECPTCKQLENDPNGMTVIL